MLIVTITIVIVLMYLFIWRKKEKFSVSDFHEYVKTPKFAKEMKNPTNPAIKEMDYVIEDLRKIYVADYARNYYIFGADRKKVARMNHWDRKKFFESAALTKEQIKAIPCLFGAMYHVWRWILDKIYPDSSKEFDESLLPDTADIMSLLKPYLPTICPGMEALGNKIAEYMPTPWESKVLRADVYLYAQRAEMERLKLLQSEN